MTSHSRVRQRLDDLYLSFDDDSYLSTDPIQMVRRFDKPADQEIMAVVSSALAFGQVPQINRAIGRALELMHHSPADFVGSFDPGLEVRRWRHFYYRMVRHTDLLRLLFVMQDIIREYGRLKDWVEANYRQDDENLGVTWGRCREDILRRDREKWRWTRSRGIGFRHLLPDPNGSSACKRVHLLLRWMVRKDRVDLGLWSSLPPSKLLIPVDTHVQRIAHNIGLTNRKDATAATSKAITIRLLEMDISDPVKYDFAICRLGILKLCPKKRDFVKCRQCRIVDICLL